jgi:hypothetical protein
MNPTNVFVNFTHGKENPEVKILDFNVSKIVPFKK